MDLNLILKKETKDFYLTFVRDTLLQRIAVRLVSWTHTESHSQRVDSAESSQTTDSNGAGVNEGTGADTVNIDVACKFIYSRRRKKRDI